MDGTVSINNASDVNIDYLKQTLDNTGFGVGIYDVDGTILYYNKIALENLDASESDIINKSIVEVFGTEKGEKYLERIQVVIQTGKATIFEDFVTLPTGNKWFTSTYSPIYNNQGQIIAVQIITNETTKIKNLQIEKDVTLKKLRHAMNAAHEGMWEWNLKTNKVFFDDVALSMLGYNRDDFTGDLEKGSWWMQQVHPDDKPVMEIAFQQYISGETSEYTMEFRLKNKDGGYTWVSSNGMILSYDADGKPEVVVGMHQDITEKKSIKDTINNSEEKFKLLFENSINGIVLCKLIKDNDGNPIDYIHIAVNPSTEKQLGYKPETLLNKTATELIGDEAGLKYAQMNGQSVITGDPHSWIDFVPVYEKYLKMDSFPIKDDLFAITFLDISKETIAAKQLKETSERLQNIINSSPSGIITLDSEGKVTSWNPASEQIFGWKKEEVIGRFNPTVPDELQEMYKQTIKEQHINLEIQCLKKDHLPVDITISTNPLKDNKGNFVGALGIMTDVSNEKKQKQALQNEKKFSDTVIKALPGSFYVLDTNGSWVRWNENLGKISGYTHEEFKSLTALDLIAEEDRERVSKKIQDCFTTGFAEIEADLLTKNNQRIPFYFSASSLEMDNKQFLVGTGYDITEKKQAQEDLKKNEKKYRMLFESSQDAIMTLSPPDWNFTSGNPYTLRLFHAKDEGDFINKGPWDVSPEQQPNGQPSSNEAKKMILHAMEHGSSYFEWTHKTLDGKEFPATVLLARVEIEEDKPFLQATVRDITRQKQSEKELLESEKKFKTLFNSSSDAIFIHSLPDQKIIDVNNETLRRYGYTKEEILKLTVDDLSDTSINSTKFQEAQQQYQKLLNGETIQNEWCSKKKNGETFWHLMTLKIVELDGEKRLLAQAKNIDEIVRSRNELAESEEKYRQIFEMSPIGIATADKKGNVIDINDAGAGITGHSREEIIGKSYKELHFINKKSIFKILKNFPRIIQGKPLDPIEMDVVDKNENKHIVDVQIAPIRDNLGKFAGTQTMMHDITDRKKAEEEIQQVNRDLKELNQTLEEKVNERTVRIDQLLKQKDDFINQLGHDLKNPLGPLLNIIPLLKKHEQEARYVEMIEVMQRNVDYMKNLVTKTIQLAQLQSPNTKLNMEEFNLNAEIQELIDTNKMMFKENLIEIQTKFDENVNITADKLKVQELFNNLFNNAVKYTNGEGCITIHESVRDNQVLISIQDTGKGMIPEQLDKIFSEFYKADTSRHDFDSSGLGLPICKRIVEMHGGTIWAESKGAGKGSTFYFTIPISS